jgi:hypothetical protein
VQPATGWAARFSNTEGAGQPALSDQKVLGSPPLAVSLFCLSSKIENEMSCLNQDEASQKLLG